MILGTAEGCDTFIQIAASVGNSVGYGRATDKRHSLHILVVNQALHGLSGALDHIEHPIGESSLLEQFRNPVHSEWNLLTWFEYHAIARHEGNRNRPHGNHQWKVEGNDARHDAERIAPIAARDGTGNLEGFALGQLRQAAGILDGLVSLGDVGEGLGEVLTILQNDELGQLLRVLADEGVEFQHDGRAGFHGQGGPGREGSRRSGYGGIDVGLGGYGDGTDGPGRGGG
mmetsp:Transcript_1430/g.4157  ORF Transcript_1430/g.4157 Transcript_1430/m.4157 type:complete len:229 (-) Transcript_1430:209-895(-)